MAADVEGFFERAGRPGAPGLAEPAPIRRAAHAAAFGLLLRHPGKSAAQTLSEGQRRAFLQGFALLGCGALMAPHVTPGSSFRIRNVRCPFAALLCLSDAA
jgi:hypothetical protein